MIHVIQPQIVARSLARLRDQRIHPFFAGYLHLQQLASNHGCYRDLQPDFVSFFHRFFLVKDHPIGTPYIKPFTDQKPSRSNEWLNENVAGSYAPSSLRPEQPFRKVVDITPNKKYSLREGHATLAFEHLLHRSRIPVADLVIFLYRDFGLIGNKLTVENLIGLFAWDFGYSSEVHNRRNDDFCQLYAVDAIEVKENWLETLAVEPGGLGFSPTGSAIRRTDQPIRRLAAADLLPSKILQKDHVPPLKELRIEGLLSFSEETVFEFGRLNLLVGPNGSGKSNLIDCMRILRHAPQDIQNAFASGGFEAWLNNGLDKESGSGLLSVTAQLPGVDLPLRHKVRLGPVSHSRAQLEELIDSNEEGLEEAIVYFVGSYRSAATLTIPGVRRRRKEKRLAPEDYDPFRSILGQVKDATQYPEITRLANFYSSIRIYSECTFGRDSKLREAAPAGRSDVRLSESMNDLPVALNALQQTPAHERIVSLLHDLKETYQDYVTRILFGRVGLELKEAPYDLPIPANRLSDGTLHFLALCAILLQSDPPPLICLEEPELGMHPDMIRMVAGMIVEASQKTQLIVTTHSEHLLTALQDDFDVLFVFDADVAGSSVRPFSRNEFQCWREEHLLGEL